MTDVFDVAGADALLAGGDAAAGRLLLACEPRLHRRHAGVDEQDGLVTARDQRKAGQAEMSLRFKELQVHFTQLIEPIGFVCHNGFSFVSNNLRMLRAARREKKKLRHHIGAKLASRYHPNCAEGAS